jgi:hypothetical protein
MSYTEQTFLNIDTNGNIIEKKGTKTSTGAPNAGDIPVLDETGRLDESTMPVGIGASGKAIPIDDGVTIGDGKFVNVNDSTGRIRLADSSNARKADGFVLEGGTGDAGGTVTAFVRALGEINDELSGLSAGETYFLSTAGGVTTTPPTTTDHILQKIGVAISATEISTGTYPVIKRA